MVKVSLNTTIALAVAALFLGFVVGEIHTRMEYAPYLQAWMHGQLVCTPAAPDRR